MTNDPSLTSQMDQALASLKTMAQMQTYYYNCLVETGVPKGKAFKLTTIMVRSQFGQLFK